MSPRTGALDANSIVVVPQLPEAAYDLALIDGCHGFPTAFVDFLYAARALRVGGTLIIAMNSMFSVEIL